NSFKMGRNRLISSIIGKATRRPSQPMLTRKKRDNKVPCYCNQCNGKLVLKRTKLFHESAGGSTTTIQDSDNEQLQSSPSIVTPLGTKKNGVIIKILYDVTKERFFLISLLVTW